MPANIPSHTTSDHHVVCDAPLTGGTVTATLLVWRQYHRTPPTHDVTVQPASSLEDRVLRAGWTPSEWGGGIRILM